MISLLSYLKYPKLFIVRLLSFVLAAILIFNPLFVSAAAQYACDTGEASSNASTTFDASTKEQKGVEEKIRNEDLRGVEVKFDYEGHEKERDFFYNHYLKEASDRHPLKKEEIGIYFYDLNNDGEKEVLVYLHNLGLCGVKGCLFEIFTPNPNIKDSPEQEFLELRTGWGFLPEIVKVLDSVTLGYHDIEIAGSIWKWDGVKYK